MEKHIIRWSYWLGMASFAISLVEGATSHWISPSLPSSIGRYLWYGTFFKAGILLLLVTIATANYARFNSRNPSA
jgi:hypothetical protein